MKQDSLKELQEAVAILSYTSTDLSNAGEDILNALAHLRAAVFMETPNAPDKFNLYEVADDDNGTRPVMGCVHHEGGYRVACDAHVLVAAKEIYPEALEGKNIDKKGEECESNYPKWGALFSDKQKEADGYCLDFDKIAIWRKEYAVEKKLCGKHCARPGYVKVGPAFFKVELFVKLAKFMKSVGTDTLHVEGSRRAAACFAPNGSKGLIMPAISTRIGYRDEDLADCWDRKDERVMMWEVA